MGDIIDITDRVRLEIGSDRRWRVYLKAADVYKLMYTTPEQSDAESLSNALDIGLPLAQAGAPTLGIVTDGS